MSLGLSSYETKQLLFALSLSRETVDTWPSRLRANYLTLVCFVGTEVDDASTVEGEHYLHHIHATRGHSLDNTLLLSSLLSTLDYLCWREALGKW